MRPLIGFSKTYSTNQIKQTQQRLAHPRFPALGAVHVYWSSDWFIVSLTFLGFV